MLADLPREVVPLKSHHNSAGTIDEPFGWRDVLEQKDLQPRGGWGNSASAIFLIVPRSDSCTGIHRECIAHLRANLQRQLVRYRRELFAHSIGVVGPLCFGVVDRSIHYRLAREEAKLAVVDCIRLVVARVQPRGLHPVARVEHRVPCRGEQLSRRCRHCAVSHVAQQLDELWVLLAADFGEHEAFSDDLGPALGLEAEDGLRAVRVVRGRQLPKVAGKNNLNSTKWVALSLSDDSANLVQLVKEVAVQHRHFINDQHFGVGPPLQRIPPLSDLCNELPNTLSAQPNPRPAVQRDASDPGRCDPRRCRHSNCVLPNCTRVLVNQFVLQRGNHRSCQVGFAGACVSREEARDPVVHDGVEDSFLIDPKYASIDWGLCRSVRS
eukprot:m.311893 g.311893  ORF g.311893 m.311893 type:complete len:381 (+) comp27454_c1_seq1:2302-3444(+)